LPAALAKVSAFFGERIENGSRTDRERIDLEHRQADVNEPAERIVAESRYPGVDIEHGDGLLVVHSEAQQPALPLVAEEQVYRREQRRRGGPLIEGADLPLASSSQGSRR